MEHLIFYLFKLIMHNWEVDYHVFYAFDLGLFLHVVSACCFVGVKSEVILTVHETDRDVNRVKHVMNYVDRPSPV